MSADLNQMRFYEGQHAFYRGIDLHARTMHVCILDHAGKAVGARWPGTMARMIFKPVTPVTSPRTWVGFRFISPHGHPAGDREMVMARPDRPGGGWAGRRKYEAVGDA
jgi:hypothetical protein